MNKILRFFLILILFAVISSCGTIKEGFSNQKKGGSDEFLVEKKSPLVMPPNFNELPKPKEKIEEDKSTNSIKDLIVEDSVNDDDTSKENSNLEETLLKKIKK
mgnify:CR=1 FL=1|tara:strand:+ start:41 stop:349 length:309 start_codon:yes stop_codon:yes gene_type:complete